ncbi:MAG: DUF2628 domain-containing protein [Gemmatimonadaceae bacterium]|nr:DUF2628 domain-containing protein [Gemmatimonadaceae bacterium]
MTDPRSDTSPDTGQTNNSPDPSLPAWARRQQDAANPLTDERMMAFIGAKWPTYARKFEPFFKDPSFVPTWNWSAALFTSGWLLYRKLYLAAFSFMLFPGLAFRLLTGSDTQMTMTELQKPENRGLMLTQIGVGVSVFIASGGIGNWLLFRRAQAAVRIALAQGLPKTEELPWLERVGGINKIGVALAVAVFVMSVYATMSA